MRRILVAGNWKMHGSQTMVQELLEGLLAGVRKTRVMWTWPFSRHFRTWPRPSSLLEGSDIAWGAQNLNPVAQGAHTGEVSAGMLLDFGCRYVLVGHSERRSIYGES